jgi:hypothetical protein
VLIELPDSVTAETLYLTVQATGNFQKQAIIPLVTGEQFKAAMEKAQQAKTGYTPPTMTKQLPAHQHPAQTTERPLSRSMQPWARRGLSRAVFQATTKVAA